MHIPIPYEPVEGKTYSLFGKDKSTGPYYQRIRELAQRVLEKFEDHEQALIAFRHYSKKKRMLRRISGEKENTDIISFVVRLLNASLSEYTENTNAHLRQLPLQKFRDRRLRTTREQYHLYMLEIELTNQTNRDRFIGADKKIALLPYCLQDFDSACKSERNDFDYQCKYCSKNCYQHYISRLLKKYEVDPYIWRGAGIRAYAKKIMQNQQTLAILGMACVPELVFGMRKCQRYGIPAIGIPLDANRCRRWMGEFHPNSVNLEQLEKLITHI